MDNINMMGLPEKYEVIRNNSDNTKYGILYRSPKKEEIVIEPEYTVCTAFKALGRIFIAYFVADVDGNSYYVLRNRKGDIKSDIPIYDFVACNKILYAQIKTSRGLELAVLDKELQVVKTFGTMTFCDYYTTNGNRVIPNTRQTLEVKDKDGGLCRINLTDNTMDSVISFSSDVTSRFKNDNNSFVVEEWTYELNISKGTVTKHDGAGGHMTVLATIGNLGDFISDFVVLFDVSPETLELDVKVKKHMEKYKIVKFSGIPNERATLVDKLIKSVPSNETMELIHELLAYYEMNVEETVKCLDTDFQTFFKKNEHGLKVNYSIKLITLEDKVIFMLKTERGRVHHIIQSLEDYNLLNNCVYILDLDASDIKVRETSLEDTKDVPKPKRYKGKSGTSYYGRVFVLDGVFRNKEFEEEEEKEFSLMMLDKFTYGPLVKEENKKKGRHNYTDNNIVLTTTTSDIYLMLI